MLPVDRKPPAKATMDRLAPNTAALDTPSVAGEAMGLPSTVCMTSPAADSPAPAMTAASRRGKRMYRMMRTAAVSPCPSSASTHERTDMPDEPTSSSVSVSSTTAAVATGVRSLWAAMGSRKPRGRNMVMFSSNWAAMTAGPAS